MSGKSGTLAELGEDGVIALFNHPGGALGERVVVPNGDDAAAYVVEPRFTSVVTTDTLVEGLHFDFAHGSAAAVGRKLMAVNLSDIAAMGAGPRYALLSVCLPKTMRVETAQAIAGGIREMCESYGVAVIGGNVTGSPGPAMLTATLIGRAEVDELVRRRGALPGDAVYVTGQLGLAKAGLHVLQTSGIPEKEDPRMSLVAALTDPKPRVPAGRALARGRLAHAMCDVSDGLGQDLRRLLVPEGLGARLDAGRLPTPRALEAFCSERGLSAAWFALEGGEDYELLFTGDRRDETAIVDACAAVGTPVARIGEVTVEPELRVRMADGTLEDLPGGFDHF
jgi:thiamine-monophosphate kinase